VSGRPGSARDLHSVALATAAFWTRPTATG
jgi:hypothetical protein